MSALLLDPRTRPAYIVAKPQHVLRHSWAAWQSGYAADCKSVYLGSTPGAASTLAIFLNYSSELWSIYQTYLEERGLNFLSIIGLPTIRLCTCSPHQLSYFTFR